MGAIDRLAAAVRVDGWENAILGLGGAKDPSVYTRFAGRAAPLSEDVLEALYVEEHFAAKIVEGEPRAALRPGWDLSVPGDPATAATWRDWYAAREAELGVAAELAQGWVWGRLFGGAVTWIGADDGRAPHEPLDESAIASVGWFHTFDRRDVVVVRYCDDEKSPRFREPEIYRIRPLVISGVGGGAVRQFGAGVDVHASRCLRWGGVETTDRRRQTLQGWDDSVLERCWDALRQLSEDYGAKSLLLGRISQAVYKIKGLFAMLAGKQLDVLRTRMGLLEQSRSRARAIVLDTEESFENHSQPLAGLPESINAGVLRLASAADMPVTILMGQSPAGMDATGESDLDVWDATVGASRALYLHPRHERIVRLMMLGKDAPTKGIEPKGWSILYRPLRTPKPKEAAEVGKLIAETDAINIDKGVYPAEAAAFRYGPTGTASVQLDEAELKERLERRRELAKLPPKDNAELGTLAPRTAAVLDVIARVAKREISRKSALAILVELHRHTHETAEALLGPDSFVPGGAGAPIADPAAAVDSAVKGPDAEPTSTPAPPGPPPEPQSGQGAGAPPAPK